MPTLIIGLGGTGTKVIRKIRERWNRFNTTPRDVALAVIDARSRTPEGGPIDDVFFTRNDTINYGAAFDEFRDELNQWWPERIAPDDNVDYSDGCGAIRANGRFYNFRFSQNVQQTLRKAVESLITRTTFSSSTGAQKFTVYLVASLGNGTGGGTFMDVAAMIKHQLSYSAQVVRTIGVFIPASVTRHGNPGLLNLRVAGAGYGSLVEMQYEFNRTVPESDFRPHEAYTFRAWDGRDFTNFMPGRGQDDALLATPLDLALLLDRRDRRGLESQYPTLLNIASEGLAMMIEGADADSRLLDAVVATPAGKRFGSFGAARLAVPALRLLEFTTCAQTLRALSAGASDDAANWRHLFALTSPDQKHFLRGDDINASSSVSFFLEKVLQVKEMGEEGGEEINQLFDRFDGADAALLKEFEEIIRGIDQLTDAKRIVNKAAEISRFVEDNTRDLGKSRAEILVEGAVSLWLAKPTDPAQPVDAGVKWLIDAKVLEMVQAGAFGALVAWLQELKRQLEENRKSVEDYERRQWLAVESHRDIDVARTVQELQREADSILAFFKRGQLKEDVGMVRQDAKRKFEFLLWESKVEAVERFYDVVYSHVERLENAARSARNRLQDPRMTDLFENRLRMVTQELDVNLQQEVTSEGLKAEVFIGGDAVMREQLLADLENNNDTSTAAILRQLADQNALLFVDGLGSNASEFDAGVDAPAIRDAVNLIEGFRGALEQVVEDDVAPFVGTRCRIDVLLETEARSMLEKYYRHVQLDADAVDKRPQQVILQQISDVADPSVLEYIQQLDWKSSKEAAMDTAVNYYIAGKLFKTIMYATPQWAIVPRELERRNLLAFTFVTYNGQASRVAQAVELMQNKLGLIPDNVNVKAQRDDYFDNRRIDIVFIEVGAELGMLEMDQEIPAYRYALHESVAFSPHITQQYHDLGLKYLQDSGAEAAEGAALIAMAELYGVVEADRTGNFKLAQDVAAKYEDGRVIYKSFETGFSIGPRGLGQTVDFLDSKEDDAVHLKAALKDLVGQAIDRDVYGVPGESEALGWDGAVGKVANRAGELRKRAASQQDELAELIERQADELDEVAAEMGRLRGKGSPAWWLALLA